MLSFRKSLHVASNNFRKWPFNPRIYVLFLLLIMIVNIFLTPLKDFAQMAELSHSPWVFPYLSSNSGFLLLFMLGLILLFCDAPFVDNGQPYILLRSGKSAWVLGQIFYIMLASALYCLVTMLLSVLFLGPNIEFTLKWGKVLGTLAQTPMGEGYGIHYKIQLFYTPLSAMLYSFIYAWLVSVFLGLLIFVLNLNFKRFIGGILASAFVVTQLFVLNITHRYTYFSPVSWASLMVLDPGKSSMYPSRSFAALTLGSFILLCIVVALRSMKNKNVNLLAES